MSANASTNAKNAPANNAANAKNAPAANAKNAAKPSVLEAFGSIFGGKPAANKAANAPANASANKPANASANKPAAAAAEAALNAPANAKARARTLRRQRGGARGKTMRLPGPRNVLRVTGKTVGKIRNVGVYGLKKVGNGVHLVTGLLGKGTGLIGSVLRKGGKTLKGLTKRRQQTRKQTRKQ